MKERSPKEAEAQPEPQDPDLAIPYRVHRARLEAAREEESRQDARAAWIANGRAVTFLGAAALFLATWLARLPRWGNWAGLVSLAAYAALAVWHGRVVGRVERARMRQQLSRRGIARVAGRWHEFEDTGERHLEPDHPYASDLDVFGRGSLFQLMDETGTRLGEEVFARWLKAAAPPEQISERQGAVAELAREIGFRQDLVAECRLASRDKADPARFIAWAEGGPYLQNLGWLRPLGWLLPTATLTLFALGRLGYAPRPLWWAGLFAQLAAIALSRRAFSDFFARLTSGERGFARFQSAFRAVEAQTFAHPYLRRLGSGLEPDGGRVSSRIGRFERLLAFAELRYNQFHPLIHLLTLWDVHFLFRLEDWRRREGQRVRAWFGALTELEALSSLAVLAHDRPGFRFPEISARGPHLEARGLGHPLLDRPVRNDVSLPGPRSALLITGSNMSGKTTLVRAIGANAVLALAGAPACAASLSLSPLQVLTSMRVKDSLERGVSYFYAEVLRLKLVLDGASGAGGRALFLLDEILLGTNTRERQLASRRVFELLLQTGAIGAVTTHDLGLAELAQEPAFGVKNVHFRDALVDGRMSFDYRLRDGVVDTTNALRVLEQAGIPVGPKEGA